MQTHYKHIINILIPLCLNLVIVGSVHGGNMADTSIKNKFLSVATEKKWMTLDEYAGVRVYYFDGTKKILFNPTEGQRLGTATLSPDALKIVFEVMENTSSQLVMINADGSNLIKLVKVYRVSGGISWSPDNKYIAFVGKLYSEPEPEFKANEPSTWLPQRNSLILIDVNTKEMTIIIQSGIRNITTQAWSPDSKEICYEDIHHKIMIYNIDIKQPRCLIDGGENKKIQFGGTSATWSLANNMIAYQDIKTQNYIFLKPDGANKNIVIENKSSIMRMVKMIGNVKGPLLWSPDGSFILYGRGFGIEGEDTMPSVMELDTKKEYSLSQGICGLRSFGGRG